MATILRYTTTTKGSMIFAGNTLGLLGLFSPPDGSSTSVNANGIGTFTSLNNSLQATTYPLGTTFDWRENGSNSLINIPPTATVLYAELCWSGTYLTGEQDATAFIDNSIIFNTPSGSSLVAPDPATAGINITDQGVEQYFRSANVTNLISSSGFYSVQQVPGALGGTPNNPPVENNYLGWTLGIIYSDPNLPYRNMTIWTAYDPVTPNTSVDVPVSGFFTPVSGPIEARLMISAGEGDPDVNGDIVQFGPDSGSLTTLSGPNNDVDNFFASQINNGDSESANVGQLDTNGTFGTANQPHPTSTANRLASGRIGYDITNVDVSSTMVNSQTSALLRLSTVNDAYVPNLLGLQIDVASADISVVKTVNPSSVVAGEEVIYTMEVCNAGPSDAENVSLTDAVPACLLNSEYSLDGGVSWIAWTGSVNLGTIAEGDCVTVLIKGTVDPSCTGTITNTATVDSDTPDPDPTNNTSTVETRVETSADISVVKTINPDPVVAGEEAIYTMEVCNAGPSDAENVTLTDAVPACLLNPEYSLDGGVTWIAWTGSVNLGTIAAGDCVTVLIRGMVDPSCTGTITNTATVDSTTPDPDPTNNTSTVETRVETSADVSVVKTINPDPVVAGEEATYTIEVSNTGPSDAQNVRLTDIIPVCILNPEFSLDGGVTFSPWVSPYNIGTMVPGGTVTILIRGTVDPSCTGTITNTARVDSTTPDPDPTNNTSTVETRVETSADVSVVKTINPDPVVAGEEATYTMVVCNAGPSDAQNVSLTDAMPACILNPEYSLDGGVTWAAWTGVVNLGTIAEGDCVTVLIRGTVDPSCTGTITNTARVDSTTPDPDPTNNETTIVIPIDTSADLSIVKIINPAPVVAGEEVTYTIEVTNAGPSDALNVTLTDAIPACILNPEFSIDGGVTFSPWVNPYVIGTIAAGAIVMILIRGTVDPSCTGTITNTARVDSTTPDPDPTNNETTIETPIETSADLSITKTVNPDPVVAGEEAIYTIEVSNVGPSDALNVTLTDVIPACILNPEFSIDGGVTFSPWVSPYNIGIMVPGATVTILIRGTVDPACRGVVMNTARINSTTPDPDPTNNETTITTPIDTSADLSVVKISSPDPVLAGELLTYTITVSNGGPSDAQNVSVADIVPSAILNPEFSLDGGIIWSPWISPYVIGTLVAGVSITIFIRGTVDSSYAGTLTNTARVSSTTPDPDPTNNISTETTQVELARLDLVKSADKKVVDIGDTITYRVIITNSGTLIAQNIIFKDTIPEGTSFIQDSVKVNGIQRPGENPLLGVNIGDLLPKKSIVVEFEVMVDFIPCLPKLINIASVDFNFQVGSSGEIQTASAQSNEVIIDAGLKIFKQISVEENVVIPPQKPDAEEILEVKVEVEIDETYYIKTPVVTSYEGQVLTGNKLIVEGTLKQKVLYIADEPTQSVHAAHFHVPFSTFLVLPQDCKNCGLVKVEGIVEDVFFQLLEDKRTVFKNITLFIQGKNICK
ncbi:DUF7507 domain-containing protein [Inediibacterium massiliense]|uniref:DUF7507 domain-containing protein n=1 Tax=Inediibacterium massiliense TaxID=1658111 RepID=UPI0006B684AD|nr:SPOCS domain-containing protein [Inediibacterium massiliense]